MYVGKPKCVCVHAYACLCACKHTTQPHAHTQPHTHIYIHVTIILYTVLTTTPSECTRLSSLQPVLCVSLYRIDFMLSITSLNNNPSLIDFPREAAYSLLITCQCVWATSLQCQPFPFCCHIRTMKSLLKTVARGRFQLRHVQIQYQLSSGAVLPSKLAEESRRPYCSSKREPHSFVVLPVAVAISIQSNRKP